MMVWLNENLSTILVSLIIVFAVVLAIRSIRKDKANGKSSCGGNCNSCGGLCHSKSNLVDTYHHDHTRKC